MTKIRIWKTKKTVTIVRFHHSTDLEGEGKISDVGKEWYDWLIDEQKRTGIDWYQNMLHAQYNTLPKG